MNKEQFLGASLHTWLKVLRPDNETILEIQGIYGNSIMFTDRHIGNTLDYKFGDLAKSKIIARPLSDLTKPITHNGKTFVPLVELAKIADMNVTDDFKCVEHHNAWGIRFKDEDDEGVFYEILSYSSNTNSFSTQTIQGEDIISERVLEMTFNQLQLFQKLIEWHFNLMDESEPFIPVTEEFNPYK